MSHFVVYVRRSYVKSGAPDISDEAQIEAAVAMLPDGSTHEIIADSGGHHSGRTDDREGYRQLIARVDAGSVDGLAVYDLSRLARNARLMHDLHARLEARRVPLLVATMPNSKWDTAVGRFMFGTLVNAAQFQADLDSERMTGLMRTLFEDGRHRGQDPYGYRSTKDDYGRRLLVPDPDEAAVVRDVFHRLARQSFSEIGRAYGWTPSRVKDIYRRARLYLGFVVEKRGMDERPGRHEAIVDDDEYSRAVAGVIERSRGRIRRPPKRRLYLLAGILHCGDCRHRMIGQTQMSRGQEWRYYICRRCPAPSVRGDEAERAVVSELLMLPPMSPAAIDAARRELHERLSVPQTNLADKQRERLEKRLSRLRQQHEWGDIADEEYRAKMAETRSQLAILPMSGKVIVFDRMRALAESLPEVLRGTDLVAKAEVIRVVVRRAEAREREVDAVFVSDALYPFLDITLAPPDGLARPVVTERVARFLGAVQ